MKKVSIIGAGNVGSTLAFLLALKGIADISLIDKFEGIAAGKALDISHAISLQKLPITIHGGSDYLLTKNSNLVVITAGIARKPGMSREDLLNINSGIMKEVIKKIMEYSTNPVIIVVSNPLDILTMIALNESGLPHHKVMGMAGILDSSRLQYSLYKHTGEYNKDLPLVLGSHGNTMVPILSKIKSQTPINPEVKNTIIEETQQAGGMVVSHLKNGSAYFAPALSILQMVESILLDRNNILPATVYTTGQYGVFDSYLGLPARLGKEGVKEIVEIPLSREENNALMNSAEYIQKKTQEAGYSYITQSN